MSSWRDVAIKVAEPKYLNAPKLFQPHHVVVAFLLIGANQPLGRYDLVQSLSIGEGSTRTMLKRLTEAELIVAEGRQGQVLTPKGKELFDAITKDIPLGLFLELGNLSLYEFDYANVAKKRGSKISDGINQRDEAMTQGGYGKAGATSLVMRDGMLVMPPDDTNTLASNENETLLILESLRPENGDAIIIGSAVDRNLAREASMAAVMTLYQE